MDLLDLQGRTALVTGAGLVGREIAATLAAHGAGTVVVCDLVRDNAPRLPPGRGPTSRTEVALRRAERTPMH